MQAIEFQTTWKKIVSAVPKEKRHKLDVQADDDVVRVIVLRSPQHRSNARKDLLQDAKEKGYGDFLEYLLDYPPDVAGPVRFTREELHER